MSISAKVREYTHRGSLVDRFSAPYSTQTLYSLLIYHSCLTAVQRTHLCVFPLTLQKVIGCTLLEAPYYGSRRRHGGASKPQAYHCSRILYGSEQTPRLPRRAALAPAPAPREHCGATRLQARHRPLRASNSLETP